MDVAVSGPPFAVSEYLRRERTALRKHEYRDGEILLMAGGSPDHSLIVANVIGEIGTRLKGKSCHIYDSNLRVNISETVGRRPGYPLPGCVPLSPVLYTYPDATVICGPRAFDRSDEENQTVINPRLIVEVLSPTTEAYDRGEKFDRYRQIESFDQYVLVTTTAPRIEVFLRQAQGLWLLAVYSGLDAIAKLSAIDIDLPLSEVYLGVEFPPVPATEAE
jgi:Uma2 family endonuclease